jgi:long-subunit fatty acid transport protein
MPMRRHDAFGRLLTAACAGGALVFISSHAAASNPLEYPDNGAAAFSRGGAWLATASDPLAAHYNPAAMATQSNGFELSLLFAYNSVCYSRKNPGNAPTGPTQNTLDDPGAAAHYIPVCNETSVQPRIIPSLGVVWRAADDLAFGFAVVPPATYGSTPGEWPTTTEGRLASGQSQSVPAPYRYMTVGARATILHPTFSFGYELAKGFRVGAGFIWSVAVIDTESFGAATTDPAQKGDAAQFDSHSRLRTKDLFVPGAILAIHWSLTENLDAALWGRWIDAINATDGQVDVLGGYYDGTAGYSRPAPVCQDLDTPCQGQAVPNRFEGADFKQFRYVATPPEARAGIRFHLPRAKALSAEALPATGPAVRDPLRDDVFDVEVDGSYTMNSVADTITIRFRGSPDGRAIVPVRPQGNLPPRADRPTGYKDSWGVRLGGQYNIVAGKFAVRAGTWYETAAADAEWLNISPVPAARGGFGGGIVYRHGSMDFSAGYQRHYSMGLDNNGDGALKAGAGTSQGGIVFQVGQPPDAQQFRTYHAVNGGRVEQSADVFTLGAVYRF